MKRILAIVILIGVLTLCSCGKQEIPNTPTQAQSGVTSQFLPHTITDAEIGKDAVCPVMGTPIKVTKDTLSLEYNGKVYYFCCAGCPEKFKENPDKYAK